MMADPTQDKVLHIPSDLYNALKAQGGNPGTMDLSSKASQDWKKLFSTEEFDEICLRDTQKNIVGLIKALGAFKSTDEVVAARQAIKWLTIIIEAPVQQDGSQAIESNPPALWDSICPTLPKHLATALRQLTGLRGLCMTLKHFTNEQICNFVDELADEQLLWPELHSLRIEAPPQAVIELMRHANPLKIRPLPLYEDIETTSFNKALGIQQLDSHNTSERSDHDAGVSSLDPDVFQKISEVVGARIEAISAQMDSEIATRAQAAVETQTAHQKIIFEQTIHQTAQTEMESQRSQLQRWVTHDLSDQIKPMIDSTMKELKVMLSKATKTSVASELSSQQPEIEKRAAELVQATVDSKMSSCISNIESATIRLINDKVKKGLESKLVDFDNQILEMIRKASDKVKTLLAPLGHPVTHREHNTSEPATDTPEIDSPQATQEPVISNREGVSNGKSPTSILGGSKRSNSSAGQDVPSLTSQQNTRTANRGSDLPVKLRGKIGSASDNEAGNGQSATGTKRSATDEVLYPGLPKQTRFRGPRPVNGFL